MKRLKYFIPFIALGIILLIGCPKKEPVRNVEPLKQEIKKNVQKRDSAKAEVTKTESKQKEVKKVWRQRRADLLPVSSPCRDTIIQIIAVCDTVLFVDSVLIAAQKRVIRLDSAVINNQGQLILSQDLIIKELTIDLKKERRRKKFWRAATLIAAGVVGGIVISR